MKSTWFFKLRFGFRHFLFLCLILGASSWRCEGDGGIFYPPPEKPNLALFFDGENGFVRIPDSSGSLDLSDFTIECWVRIEKPGKIHELVVKDAFGEDPAVNSNYSLDVWSDQRLRIVFENENQENDEIFGNTIIETGRFYHVAASFDSRSRALSLFLNGELDAGPAIMSGKPNQQNQDLRIGTGYEGGARTTTWGIIDDVRIWNRARTGSEIRKQMKSTLTGNEPGLMGNWLFDEGNAQIVHDRSRFKNHGTLGWNEEVETDDPVWVFTGIGELRSGRRDRY